MKIRLIGSGSPYCRHPLVPVSLLVQTSDGGNLVVNCPPQISSKLESIAMSLSDIDVWLLTSAGVSWSGGIEEVCNTQLTKSTVLAAAPSLMPTLREKYAPSRGSNKKVSEVSSPKVRLEDDHFEEKISYDQSGVVFESSSVALTDIHGIAKFADCQTILCNVMNGTTDMSVEFDYLREFPLYIQAKIWLVGYGNTYQTIEDPLPIMFMPQGTCVFDSERKERHISKERFIASEGKRLVGNKPKAS
jgi:hypothetical protein